MKQRKPTTGLFTLLLLLAASPATQAGKQVSRFGNKQAAMTVEDFRPRLSSDGDYHENYSVSVYMDDGSYAGADFIISNLGIGDFKGAVRASYSGPTGTTTKKKCGGELDTDQWKYAKAGPFDLQFGPHRLHGDDKQLVMTIRCDDMQMDINLQAMAAPAKPGSGQLLFGTKDGTYSMDFPSPSAKATGTVSFDGKKIAILGTGHVSHSRTDMRPDENVHRWFRFKKVTTDATIIMAEMEASREYDYYTNGWVLIFDDQGKQLVTARTNFEFDGYIKDQKHPEGYMIPRRVRLAATDGATHLTGELLMTNIAEVTDPTEDLSSVVRTVVQHFSKPRNYTMNCTYVLKLQVGETVREFKGSSTYKFLYVNP